MNYGGGGAKELVGTMLYVVSEHAISFESAIIMSVDWEFCAYSGV